MRIGEHLGFVRPSTIGAAATAPAAQTGGPTLRRLGTPRHLVMGVAAAATLGVAIRWLTRDPADPLPPVAVDAVRGDRIRPGGDQDAKRAIQVWNDLNRVHDDGSGMPDPRQTGMFRGYADSIVTGAVWPLSQIHAASLNLAMLTGDHGPAEAIDRAHDEYAVGGAYSPVVDPELFALLPWFRRRYSDDNMAIGLSRIQAFLQTGRREHLEAAEDLFPFLAAQVDEETGGLNWREGSTAYVADAIAGGMKYALLLYQLTDDPQRRREYLDFATTMNTFVENRLRVHEGPKAGLIIDNVESNNETAAWSDVIFSYNQGWSIGADVEWYRITGDRTYLDRARRTADATLAFYARNDRLWKQPPSFNAPFFENLIALEQADPSVGSRYSDALRTYLDRAWTEARDSETGYFVHGGVGSYQQNPEGTPADYDAIDHAAFVQMYALAALSDEHRAKSV